MKTFLVVVAVASATLLSTGAFSQQQFDGVDGFGHPIKAKPEYHQPARNERAYQDALGKIPDQKQSTDPWQTVRDKPQSNGSRN
jgi:hypothetical protein